MNPPRLLYLDTPFETEPGGDKNRSRFLWQSLRGPFEAEWVRLLPFGGSSDGPDPGHSIRPALTLPAVKGPWGRSASVLHFAGESLAAFRRLLDERRPRVVVARFHAPWELCRVAASHSARPAVAMDLDMVSSRLVALSWQQDRSFRNRWFWFEQHKLRRFERRLLRQPWLVLLSNPVEMADLRAGLAPQRASARLAEVPNVMPAGRPLGEVPRRPVILFFGSLNSGANTDAFRFLMDDLWPGIEPHLKRHGATLHVAGKHPPPWFARRLEQQRSDRVQLVGPVDSMERALAESRFVFLPLRVASGTRTRILEAAAQARAVITTPIGAEGIDVGQDARVHESPAALAEAVGTLLDQPREADAMGFRLRARCLARYGPERVAADLVAELEDFLEGHPPPPVVP